MSIKNTYKEPVKESQGASVKEPKKQKKKAMFFQVLNGEVLQKDIFLKNLPFVFFVSLLLGLYISNVYYAESKIREINQLENQIKELHAEYISTKAELTQHRKEYQVEKALGNAGIKVSIVPPRIIRITKKEAKEIY